MKSSLLDSSFSAGTYILLEQEKEQEQEQEQVQEQEKEQEQNNTIIQAG